jgi:murein tripeptide amidase MpaA
LASVTLALVAAGFATTATPAAAAAGDALNAYRVAPTVENKRELAQAGFDLIEGDKGSYLEIYATDQQVRELRADGIAPKLLGEKRESLAVAPPYTGSDAEYDVWTRYDAVPGDGKEQYVELYNRLEGMSIVKKMSIGKTHLGRDIWALKVTKNAKTTSDNRRPAVLYNAQQHAREWLAGETCKRTLKYFTDNYGKNTEDGEIVTPLVDTRELWFVCISNPDGFEYTFTEGNRLWRKNMADNNGDGVRGEPGDGVDPNRNFPTNWGRDDEGSASDPYDETYRGTGPASEPETKAMLNLWKRVDFAFQKNDHTAAELLLYPLGYQQYTEAPDDGIFTALAGDDVEPGIADKEFDEETGEWHSTANRFDPDLGAELYITNGDTLESAYDAGILGFTPEGSEPDPAKVPPGSSGFEFQDDEADVQAEFERHRLFSIDLAVSAEDPANPVSHMGNTARNFYVDSFRDSYGSEQWVQVDAKKTLQNVQIRWRINGGPVKTGNTRRFYEGERFGTERGIYYDRLRGRVRGAKQGDEVEVWFTGKSAGSANSQRFTYTVRRASDADVLIMSAENYTAGVPAQDPDGPHYLTYYTDALDTLGVDYEIYDVDRRDNRSPHHLGVLSHFDTVIWYTGDDYLTRLPGQMPGTGTARLAVEEMIDVRSFLNEGGKLFYTGKYAGAQYAEGNPFRNFGFPEPRDPAVPNAAPGNVLDGQYCDKNGTAAVPEFNEDDPTQSDGCVAHNDDFLQYYLGAYIYASPGQTFDVENGRPYSLTGTDDGPFADLDWSFDETGANNQDHSATFVVTSSILDPAEFPLYADSRSAADWLRPGAAPFSPYSGTQYMASGRSSYSYKRLGKVLDLTGRTAPQLNFKFSGDMEPNWDWVIVEARDPATDEWTTLPEVDTDGAGDADVSLTTQNTGDSCPEGLGEQVHPQLLHYWTVNPADTEDGCDPTGTTGEWHAYTGSSGGWNDWTVDLSDYAGEQVEIRIAAVTDWGTLGLGAWVDDWRLTDGATEIEFQDFEQPLDDSWLIGPPPEGTPLPNGWTQTGQEFIEGGVVTTEDTVYTGFGFEGINEAARTEFMARTLDHLDVATNPVPAAAPQPAAGDGAGAPTADDGKAGAQSAKGRAYAKLKSVRLKGKRKAQVRLAIEGDAGASVAGRVKLARGKASYGSKRFKGAAGQVISVNVQLSKKARRVLARGKTLKATVVASGADGSGAAINARRAVRLAARK